MEENYDRKFEEMKKYIPFLESMIRNLEITNTPLNPRQAQLDKIRSLRDLLMGKKKRMKKENLLKCEQVLINLCAKIEKSNSLAGPKRNPTPDTKTTNLNVVRNKLKSVVSKMRSEGDNTLPEIARASKTEETCVPGSKEPALFQRRPNVHTRVTSTSPSRKKEPSPPNIKKNYTRLLLSPDRNPKSWTREHSDEKPLFVRRSPKKSPRKSSPSYHRKERKKSLKVESNVGLSKDLNITLNVSEDSLQTLNTKDIVTRIINCNDNDVDIETLRGLRTQILGELEETGAKDDISEIILKSYKKKDAKNKKSEEVEEGELSDSESEAIENIYGSLVILDKDKSNINLKPQSSDISKPCKIQICLVINSEKQKENSPTEVDKTNMNFDPSDFESFNIADNQSKLSEQNNENGKTTESNITDKFINLDASIIPSAEVVTTEMQVVVDEKTEKETNHQPKQSDAQGINSNLIETAILNHYKQVTEDVKNDEVEEKDRKSEDKISSSEIAHDDCDSFKDLNVKLDTETPLLPSETTQSEIVNNKVSEIDILQALKNEILSETSNVLSTDVEAPLFQPKITKVANAQEIGYKKRISIEKYKAMATTKSLSNCESDNSSKDDVLKKQSLKLTEKEWERFFLTKEPFDAISDSEDQSNLSGDDFYENLAPKSPDHDDFADAGLKPPVIIPSDPIEIPAVASEKDIDMRKILPLLNSQDIVNNVTCAPDLIQKKNVPRKEKMFNNIEPQTAQLVDPRKCRESMLNNQINGFSVLSPNINLNSLNEIFSPNFNHTLPMNLPGSNSSSIGNLPQNRNPVTLSPTFAPNLIPNRLQNIGGNMTPNSSNNSRTFDTTPSRQSFDNEDSLNRKHVYTPIYPSFESQGYNEKSRKSRWVTDNNIPVWEDVGVSRNNSNNGPIWEHQVNSRNSTNTVPIWEALNSRTAFYDRYNVESRDQYIRDDCQAPSRHSFRRMDCPLTPIPSFGRSDCPPAPIPSFGRSDCPPTPIPSFGRLDCPPTPISSFGRSDCPPTPIPSFGRLDCPPTPISSFGRSDCPPTPIPSFGRLDCPPTPISSFGRSDCPQTQTYQFGRHESPMASPHTFGGSDYTQAAFGKNFNKSQDTRLYRNSDNDNYHGRDRDRERYNLYESKFNSNSHELEQRGRLSRSDSYRRYQREQSLGRSDRNKFYEHTDRGYRESLPRRETSDVRQYNDDLEVERFFTRNRGSSSNYDYRHQNESYNYDKKNRRGCQNERSTHRNTRDLSLSPTQTSKDNKVEIHSHSGYSFSICTSSKNSFIETKKGNVLKFDSRRQRAASVGRTLTGKTIESRGFRESKQSLNSSESEIIRKPFQRSSSVGREIRDSDKDFKDIKDSLKLFKLKSDSKVSTYMNKKEVLSNKKIKFDSGYKSLHSNVKYSPRKNNRDPRIIRSSYQMEKSDSRDSNSKHCGIVYTNDNITKGTILGSGFGVKNYKIPKIKRTNEVTESIISDGSTGCKLKDNLENNCQKAEETNVDNENSQIDLVNLNMTKDAKESVDNHKNNNDNYENKSYKSKMLETPQAINQLNIYSENEELSNSKQHLKEDKKILVPGTSFAQERRITRSATKKISGAKNLLEIAPIKRTRKQKQTLVYESDSDDNDIKSTKKNNFTEEINCAAIQKSPNYMNVASSKSPADIVAANFECVDDNKLNVKTDISVQSETLNVGENKIQDQSLKNPSTLGEQYLDINLKTVCKLPQKGTANEEIDSSFGIDDLEIFSDNIISDPVIDNINELIADLDDDLESNKNLELSNSKFTKELNLETMLENISNPCNDKNEINLSENIKINDEKALTTEFVPHGKETVSISSSSTETLETSLVTTTEKKGVRTNKEIEEKSEVVCSKNVQIQPEKTCKDAGNNDESVVTNTNDRLNLQNILERESYNKKIDNVHSLTKPDPVVQKSDVGETKLNENFPDMTNKFHNDMMNSVVISSSNNLSSNKDITEPGMSKTNTTQIESISKFLSILQDKTKIKELLGLLDQTNECEKIKKKLEKLSEIVSDDEDTEKKDKDYSKDKIAVDESESKTQQYSKSTDLKDEMKTNDNAGETIAESNSLILKKDCVLLINKTDSEVPSKIVDGSVSKQKEDQNSAEDPLKTENKKVSKAAIAKKGKKKTFVKKVNIEDKRLTRSDDLKIEIHNPKKPSRELQKLQEDIREMFIRDDVLNSTGIRMCRIAKLVDEKPGHKQEPTTYIESEPVVVLKKFKDINVYKEDTASSLRKVKGKNIVDNEIISVTTKSAQSSKIKSKYSMNELNNPSDKNDSSGSDFESIGSSKTSGSNELITEVKKTKRRRRNGWKSGIIKSKCKKKTINQKQNEILSDDNKPETTKLGADIPDLNCYIDKTYCFRKNKTSYECRLCVYSGDEIVNHYKTHHPHSEIPCARMCPSMAKDAITESEQINFKAISAISSKKYVCRFCFKEFSRNKPLIESFFWHVVSVHTGEYKQPCSECENVNSCTLVLDIPSPPLEAKGQLLGYICERCNYTQISLENLKTHIILRHNDEQTAIYTINLAFMTRTSMNVLLKQCENVQNENETARVLRSSRSHPSFSETIDNENNSTVESNQNVNENLLNVKEDDSRENTKSISSIQSKNTFENDISEYDNNDCLAGKLEINNMSEISSEQKASYFKEPDLNNTTDSSSENFQNNTSDFSSASKDIFDSPHFKIKYSKSGSKEYICCINGNEHYTTTLLISFKKHVQLKHSEKWDGYCFVCKVIVTPQGTHLFKDCLHHFLEKHIDNFPVLEEPLEEPLNVESSTITENRPTFVQGHKTNNSVGPPRKLISNSNELNEEPSNVSKISVLPVIESVVSLVSTAENPHPSPSYPTTSNNTVSIERPNKYEEVQAEMMTKKHRVVLDVMMSETKLGHVFKCAGRFCSFTSDSAEDALLHASTHARFGGEDALNCVYCDFDCHQNAIDLITHVFKNHGSCQYFCGKCFYRSVASQLVNSHIMRLHDTTTTSAVLRTSFKTAHNDNPILPREVAVPHYICNGVGGPEGTCVFKTYTPGIFCEHLQRQHASAIDFKCFMCTMKFAAPSDLIRHLKIHGLRLYQCIRCIFGADSEPDLLAHASVFHPTKEPKAYLRILTHKEGSSEFRVLPMAHLNRLPVPIIDIVPSKVKDNPVKEAERSIELEKLIGQTSLITKSIDTSEEVNTKDKETDFTFNKESEIGPRGIDNTVTLTNMEPVFIAPRVRTPILLQKDVLAKNKQGSPIKTDILVTEKAIETKPNVIYCLDSDEDTSMQSSVATNSKSSSVDKKVPLKELFMCAKCKMLLNTGIGLKRHMMWCYASVSDPISCAHCSLKLDKSKLLNHYFEVHSLEGNTRKVTCSKCPRDFMSLSLLKEHRKLEHSNTVNKNVEGLVLSNAKQIVAPIKRKRSLGSKEKSQPSEKMRRFGPQDVDQLPINPILDDFVFCSLCEFNTKVRLNMVRHLQLHAQQQPVPQTAPVNPVPHLETNEKHFDKMINLASSSIYTRTSDKVKTENTSVLSATTGTSRFPKYVPEKHRLTCGAKGCTYISVDESMLKCHWETLHHGSNEFHCVHCFPRQLLDMSQPLTSSRIIAHLKMHDSNLYACSLCTYYHYRHEILQKHMIDLHKGGQVIIVREETITTATTSQIQNPAPTMDLKPWHCGLCSFKSLLRPEVMDHCSKEHNSKMQYKCAFCEFRSSNTETLMKHFPKWHPNRPQEIFYYYYREGSVPDEPDGTKRWQKQSQKNENSEPQMKHEPSSIEVPPLQPLSKPIIQLVDLNLVKKEFIKPVDETLEDLCRDFGPFCDPNGLKYMCPLCKNVMEDDVEAIRSHLYEELKYRKWGCSICSYKAFHKVGLCEHMQVEHGHNREPIALQVDNRVETWVNKLLEHQTSLITKYKENLVKQKAEIFRVNPEPSKIQSQQIDLPKTTTANNSNISIDELKKLFGPFGSPIQRAFCCPKCNVTLADEGLMQNHLECELNKIRWFCSACYLTFQTFHEAQFHCRSAHPLLRPAARPSEAPRDPSARASWVQTVLTVQRFGMTDEMDFQPGSKEGPGSDESLLVIRYEKTVPTPEIQQPECSITIDSDEDNLVIDETVDNKGAASSTLCTVCGYCSFNGTKINVMNHQRTYHAGKPLLCLMATFPKKSPRENANRICLVCKHSILDSEVRDHVHPNDIVSFANKGDIVFKCILCSALSKELQTHLLHHQKHHPNVGMKYTTIKLNFIGDRHKIYTPKKCGMTSLSMKQLKAHSKTNCCDTSPEEEIGKKRKNDDNSNVPSRKVARKSTAKIPHKVARKSTTKLPLNAPSDETGSSLHGTQPISEDLSPITTMMPFCNMMVPFTLKKLNEIININPVVLVKRMKMD